MKAIKTLLALYARGLPGGLGDLKRLRPPRPASLGELLRCLKPGPGALEDPVFFGASTAIMFFFICRAVAEIGNSDATGRFTASNLADGIVILSIAGGAETMGGQGPLQAAIRIEGHRLRFSRTIPERYHALMEFSSIGIARKLFEGQVSALGCVGQGLISMRGNLGMLDNINRILDRVAVYLA